MLHEQLSVIEHMSTELHAKVSPNFEFTAKSRAARHAAPSHKRYLQTEAADAHFASLLRTHKLDWCATRSILLSIRCLFALHLTLC